MAIDVSSSHRHKYCGDDEDMVCTSPGPCSSKHLRRREHNQWELVVDTPIDSVAQLKSPTARSLVKEELLRNQDGLMTATELSRAIGRPVASVSSVLKLMVDAGELRRFPGTGPRGGYGYARTDVGILPCVRHPRYQGLRRPRTACDGCQRIWSVSAEWLGGRKP